MKKHNLLTALTAAIILVGDGAAISANTNVPTVQAKRHYAKRHGKKRIARKRKAKSRKSKKKRASKKRKAAIKRRKRNDDWKRKISKRFYVSGTKNDYYVEGNHNGKPYPYYQTKGVTMTLPGWRSDYLSYSNHPQGSSCTVMEVKLTNNSQSSVNIGDFIKKHLVAFVPAAGDYSHSLKHTVVPLDDDLHVKNGFIFGESTYLNKFDTDLQPGESQIVAFGNDKLNLPYHKYPIWYLHILNNKGKELGYLQLWMNDDKIN